MLYLLFALSYLLLIALASFVIGSKRFADRKQIDPGAIAAESGLSSHRYAGWLGEYCV